jgi:ABC-2 type transport system permease protein
MVQPISAVFYPVSVLPTWLQPVAWCTPATHVFEGMREVLQTGQMAPHHMWCAFGLNIVLMIVCGLAFNGFLAGARKRGFLAKYAT